MCAQAFTDCELFLLLSDVLSFSMDDFVNDVLGSSSSLVMVSFSDGARMIPTAFCPAEGTLFDIVFGTWARLPPARSGPLAVAIGPQSWHIPADGHTHRRGLPGGRRALARGSDPVARRAGARNAQRFDSHRAAWPRAESCPRRRHLPCPRLHLRARRLGGGRRLFARGAARRSRAGRRRSASGDDFPACRSLGDPPVRERAGLALAITSLLDLAGARPGASLGRTLEYLGWRVLEARIGESLPRSD